MKGSRAVGWLCLGIIVVIFTTYGTMALGGTQDAGTLYAAENQTALVAGILGVLLSLLLIAASVGADPALRGVALAVAAVALAAPAVYLAAQDVQPAASDTLTCGTVTSPASLGTRRESAFCGEGLRRQKALVAIAGMPPAVVAIASVVALARRTRPHDEETAPAAEGPTEP